MIQMLPQDDNLDTTNRTMRNIREEAVKLCIADPCHHPSYISFPSVGSWEEHRYRHMHNIYLGLDRKSFHSSFPTVVIVDSLVNGNNGSFLVAILS